MCQYQNKGKLYFALGVMWGEVVFVSGVLWEESAPNTCRASVGF
jgi:hypothetical protein